MKDEKKSQVEMHKNFFDRCEKAIEDGFYLEAIFHEYAAIESRLEVTLGVLGMPCNKNLQSNIRKDINISQRINCLKGIMNNSSIFEKSKLDNKFFKSLENWITERNGIIHGLYKNEKKYKPRMKNAKELAEQGCDHAKKLYNEASRLRKIRKNHKDLLMNVNELCKGNCKFLKEEFICQK